MKNLYSLLILLFFAGCGTGSQYMGKNDNYSNKEYRIFEEIIYDNYSLPQFKNEIFTKDGLNKNQYVVVFYKEGRFVESRHVGIVPGSDDASFTKPFRVVYQWTGKGFKAGWDLLDNFRSQVTNDLPAGFFSKEIAMVITGTAGGIGGFAVGLGAGSKSAYEELHKFFSKREILLNMISYKYDPSGRLELMQIFNPEKDGVLLAETKYYYKKNKNPYKAVIRNLQTKEEFVKKFR